MDRVSTVRYGELHPDSAPRAVRVMAARIVRTISRRDALGHVRIRWAMRLDDAADPSLVIRSAPARRVRGWADGQWDGFRWTEPATIWLVVDRADAVTVGHELRHLVQIRRGYLEWMSISEREQDADDAAASYRRGFRAERRAVVVDPPERLIPRAPAAPTARARRVV